MGALPPEGVPLEQLRRSLRERIAESSFRIAAREVGMSPSGLHSFLAGTSPHYSTLRKVTNWYVREARRAPDASTIETVRAAIGLLVEHLPESARRAATQGVLTAIRQATEESGSPIPKWIDQVP